MSYANRKELLRKISEKRGRNLISYVTTIRPNMSCNMAGDAIIPVIEQIDSIPDTAQEVDFLIISNGGDPITSLRIMSLLRERFDKIEALYYCLKPWEHTASEGFYVQNLLTQIARLRDAFPGNGSKTISMWDIQVPDGARWRVLPNCTGGRSINCKNTSDIGCGGDDRCRLRSFEMTSQK